MGVVGPRDGRGVPLQGPLGDTRLPYLSAASHHTPSGLRVLESKGQIRALPPGDLGELGRIMGNFPHLQSRNNHHHRHLWSHCDTKQNNLLDRPSVGLTQQGHWCPAGRLPTSTTPAPTASLSPGRQRPCRAGGWSATSGHGCCPPRRASLNTQRSGGVCFSLLAFCSVPQDPLSPKLNYGSCPI